MEIALIACVAYNAFASKVMTMSRLTVRNSEAPVKALLRFKAAHNNHSAVLRQTSATLRGLAPGTISHSGSTG